MEKSGQVVVSLGTMESRRQCYGMGPVIPPMVTYMFWKYLGTKIDTFWDIQQNFEDSKIIWIHRPQN